MTPEFPSLYLAADQSSLAAQRRYLRLTIAQLVFLAAAAATTMFTWQSGEINYAALAGAFAFVFAGVVRVQIQLTNPTRTWYLGRAASASAKTLTWRYACGGDPFPVEMSAAAADRLFVERLHDIVVDLHGLKIIQAAEADEITDWMRDVRQQPLADRKDIYAKGRIGDQQAWYSSKARWNTSRARRWGAALLLLEAFGVLQALLKATGVVDVNLLGFMATVVAGIAAWIQTKDYETLSSSYAVASQELNAIKALIVHQETEEQWADFVSDAEESISREHTLWRASRS
jgi:hypothetical protein